MSSESTIMRGRRPYSYGKLYDLLALHFPDHRSAQGVFDIPKLAKDLGMANETLYRAVRGNPEQGYPEGMIKVAVALKLIEFSHENHPEQPLFWDDLREFVMPHYRKFADPMLT